MQGGRAWPHASWPPGHGAYCLPRALPSLLQARYRICREHNKARVVNVRGVPSRWCQQCGKFEPLAVFKGNRRSCYVKLLKHNSRRKDNLRRVGECNAVLQRAVSASPNELLQQASGSWDSQVLAVAGSKVHDPTPAADQWLSWGAKRTRSCPIACRSAGCSAFGSHQGCQLLQQQQVQQHTSVQVLRTLMLAQQQQQSGSGSQPSTPNGSMLLDRGPKLSLAALEARNPSATAAMSHLGMPASALVPPVLHPATESASEQQLMAILLALALPQVPVQQELLQREPPQQAADPPHLPQPELVAAQQIASLFEAPLPLAAAAPSANPLADQLTVLLQHAVSAACGAME